MEVLIRISGGLAGLTFEGRVNTATLPIELKGRCESLLSEESLNKASRHQTNEMLADGYLYEVTLRNSNGLDQQYSIKESQATATLLELLDDLKIELSSSKER